MQWSRSCRCSS